MIVLFCLFNYKKLSGYLPQKTVLGVTCVIVRGGFEGLGDPSFEAQPETPNATHMLNRSLTNTEVERDSLALSASQMEYQRQKSNSKGKLPAVNQEGPAEPIPIQTGTSSRLLDFNYVMGLGNPCPWAISHSPPSVTPNLQLSRADGENEPTGVPTSVPSSVSSLTPKIQLKKSASTTS